MRLTPPEFEIAPTEGFAGDKDLFGYRQFGERLANIIHNIDQPLVIALDGPWGSGKSTFVKQWAGLLRRQGASVIHFDAFGNDHYEDAFLALSAQIYGMAKEELGGDQSAARKYLNIAKKTGGTLVPVLTRVGARVATAGLLSLEDVQEGGEAAKAALQSLGMDGEKWIEKAVSEKLRGAAEEKATFEAFREALSSLAAEVNATKSKLPDASAHQARSFPLIVIVDELDRCRPPFALSVIERTKHFFAVRGVCFVLVTHLPQLEAAIQGAYGSALSAQEYLEKFYHLRVTLPREHEGRSHVKRYINHLWKCLDFSVGNDRFDNLMMNHLTELAEIHGLSFRRLERIVSNVAIVSAAVGPHDPFSPPLAAGLCLMRVENRTLYEAARDGRLTFSDALNFLFGEEAASVRTHQAPSDPRVDRFKWIVDWWRFATDEPMTDEELADFRNSAFDNRKDVLPTLTSYIDRLELRSAP